MQFLRFIVAWRFEEDLSAAEEDRVLVAEEGPVQQSEAAHREEVHSPNLTISTRFLHPQALMQEVEVAEVEVVLEVSIEVAEEQVKPKLNPHQRHLSWNIVLAANLMHRRRNDPRFTNPCI